MGIVLFASAGSALAEPRSTRNITGLPPEAVARLPGAARLFEVRNASAPPQIRKHEFIPGQVVARFPPELIDDEIEQLAWLVGADRVERLSPLGLFLIYGPANRRATEKLMEELWETHTAVSIEANYVGELAFIPNDPNHVNGLQWYHEAPSGIDLNLRAAWDITTGSPAVVIAVIDTGVDIDHPEFVGRLYVNPGEIPGNGIDDDGNNYVDDVSGWNTVPPVSGDVNDTTVGHGTWVASILLANSNNSHQIAGFDHSALILPLKALASQSGTGAALEAALDYLIANPGIARIVNMSVAHYAETSSLESDLSAAAENSILIGGSGNRRHLLGPGGADNEYPESHPDVITVGATDSADALGYFSDTGNSLEFTAPGVEIATASWTEPNNPTAAQVVSGTSLATPMVSGTAALGLSIRPTMSRSDLIFALKESAVDLGTPGWDPDFGFGRIDTEGGLLALQSLIFINDFETGDLTAWSSFSP